MWFALVALGIIGTFAAPPASIEGAIYTVLPLWLHVTLLPELLLQSFLLSWIVFQWVRHPERRWLTWTMGAAFMLVMTLGAIALLGAVR